jgi:D-ribose pyranose/furanose isomerase RbsD
MIKSIKPLKITCALMVLGVLMFLFSCIKSLDKSAAKDETVANTDWKLELNKKIPMLGHRNWILVVDKAFPEQNAPGIEYLYANEDLLPVLKEVLTKIKLSSHIKPVIYQDKELGYITEEQVKGVKQFVTASKSIIGDLKVQTMLHDSVFRKLDTESKLFKVLVIKTNETIPYTSVFLQLDCAYWNADKEKQLRLNMR